MSIPIASARRASSSAACGLITFVGLTPTASLGPNGRLYVCDRIKNRVQEFERIPGGAKFLQLHEDGLPGMDERALRGCVDWVAHGFELVQSIFPRWEFTLPDTVAAYGLFWHDPATATGLAIPALTRRAPWIAAHGKATPEPTGRLQ